ncbi:hypothetical protein VTG60DRAFT_1758 [Thermothelomyces hinnuleus]
MYLDSVNRQLRGTADHGDLDSGDVILHASRRASYGVVLAVRSKRFGTLASQCVTKRGGLTDQGVGCSLRRLFLPPRPGASASLAPIELLREVVSSEQPAQVWRVTNW